MEGVRWCKIVSINRWVLCERVSVARHTAVPHAALACMRDLIRMNPRMTIRRMERARV